MKVVSVFYGACTVGKWLGRSITSWQEEEEFTECELLRIRILQVSLDQSLFVVFGLPLK